MREKKCCEEQGKVKNGFSKEQNKTKKKETLCASVYACVCVCFRCLDN